MGTGFVPVPFSCPTSFVASMTYRSHVTPTSGKGGCMYKKKIKTGKIQWPPPPQYGMQPPEPKPLIRIGHESTDEIGITDVVLENNFEHPFSIIESAEGR